MQSQAKAGNRLVLLEGRPCNLHGKGIRKFGAAGNAALTTDSDDKPLDLERRPPSARARIFSGPFRAVALELRDAVGPVRRAAGAA